MVLQNPQSEKFDRETIRVRAPFHNLFAPQTLPGRLVLLNLRRYLLLRRQRPQQFPLRVGTLGPVVMEVGVRRHQHLRHRHVQIAPRRRLPLLRVQVIDQVGGHRLQQVRLAVRQPDDRVHHALFVVQRRHRLGQQLPRVGGREEAEFKRLDVDQVIRPVHAAQPLEPVAAGEEDDDARAVLDDVAELVEDLAGDLLRRDPFFQPLVLVEGDRNLILNYIVKEGISGNDKLD